MPFKTVLTYYGGDPGSADRLKTAINLARQFDAHLTTVAFGYDPDMPAHAYGEASGAAMALLLAQAQTSAQERAAKATEILNGAGVLGEVVPEVCTYAGLPRAFGRHAQFADLVILGPAYCEDVDDTAGDALEGALFDGDAIILACQKGVEDLDFSRVLIAWNGGREALRAVRRALPILKQAAMVEILIIDPTLDEPEPGRMLATLLSRHGVNVEIFVHPKTSKTTTEVLKARISETGASLLVMGGYGHSRFREYVIGGVTRDILSALPVPVLMAH